METETLTQNYLSEIITKEASVGIIIGMKKVGKSTDAIALLMDYAEGNVRQDIPKCSSIIVDTNNEYGDLEFQGNEHHSIETIEIDEIPQFLAREEKGIRRVVPFGSDGKQLTIDEMSEWAENIIFKSMRCVVLVEDGNKFRMCGNFLRKVTAVTRTPERTMLFTFTSKRRGLAALGNIDYIRLYRTNDSAYRSADYLEEKTELVAIAEEIINLKCEGNPHYSLFVSIEHGKIKGDFTGEEITAAIDAYIAKNYRSLVNASVLKNPSIMDKKPLVSTMSDEDFARNYVFGVLRKRYF